MKKEFQIPYSHIIVNQDATIKDLEQGKKFIN